MFSLERNQSLSVLLMTELRERSLSMRKLSELTRIDTATISRIVNGKQKANLNHLRILAECLGIPFEKLAAAAGYNINFNQDRNSFADFLSTILDVSYLPNQQDTVERIKQELFKYEQFAQTEEGKQLIHREFQSKVNELKGIGPFIDQLKNIYQHYSRDNIPPGVRALYGSALLYFIIPTDVIPDFLFPFGYLDDAIAVQLVLDRVAQLVGSEKI